MQHTKIPPPYITASGERLGFLTQPRPPMPPKAPVYGFLNKPPEPPPRPEKNPYVGYSCSFTAEGGILLSAGDEEGISPGVAFCLMTGFELFIIVGLGAPFGPACLTMLIFLWFNVAVCAGLSGTKQSVEVRPDCIIIDGKDVFWKKFMEGPWPRFEPDWSSFKPNGKTSKLSGISSMKLSGIYGTRFIEYLTLERTDEFDRTPEVFDIHLRKAMNQLWNRPG